MNKNGNKYPAASHPVNGNGNGPVTLYHIYETLGKVVQQLESEIALQQSIIRKQLLEIETLRSEIGRKEQLSVQANRKLEESMQQMEGSRQLINKLLSDIAHYQNDIDWYKRTYEKRSIWGVLKDKLTRDPSIK
jgi:DNA repair exonuclease SbcCD ATPase subunit